MGSATLTHAGSTNPCWSLALRDDCIPAPKGPKHISPGQGNASSASVAVALGARPGGSVAVKHFQAAKTVGWDHCPDRTTIRLDGTMVPSYIQNASQRCLSGLLWWLTCHPGRRSAACAASLCPGLLCFCPYRGDATTPSKSPEEDYSRMPMPKSDAVQ